MIENPPVLIMKKKFDRPLKFQVDSFLNFQTGHIADAMNGRGALDGFIKPLNNKFSKFSGVALTCYCGPADNLAAIAAIRIAKEGDVIIAATDEYKTTAVMGDLMLGIGKNRGITAFITDGFVRDIEGINKLALPCFCSGVIPNSPARNGPGNIGLPVVCGGVNINSGDIIVGDSDGIVIVPYESINNVLEKLETVISLEKETEEKVNEGIQTLDFIEDIFNNGSIKEID